MWIFWGYIICHIIHLKFVPFLPNSPFLFVKIYFGYWWCISFFCLKERKKRGGIETKYQVFSHPAEYEKISLLAWQNSYTQSLHAAWDSNFEQWSGKQDWFPQICFLELILFWFCCRWNEQLVFCTINRIKCKKLLIITNACASLVQLSISKMFHPKIRRKTRVCKHSIKLTLFFIPPHIWCANPMCDILLVIN